VQNEGFAMQDNPNREEEGATLQVNPGREGNNQN